ncbi:PAS domain-containing sensor histidine kinase [Hymenobacter algoricola]|uniref:histidine kinase n=1 Tax=Hymenobacter algoricola TaxID=486267 RepID=A0ABP7NQG7_9BACT
MSDSILPPSSGEALPPAGLAEVLLNLSLAGTMLLRPLYAADGVEIIDFAWVRLNPAAQQLLGLPQYPTESLLTLFPTAAQHGVFGFYRMAFRSGQVERRQNLYQHDGLDGYYSLVAQRCEEQLVVSFIESSDHSRPAVEEALRDSQASEQTARVAAERQWQELARVFEQAPAAIAVYRGPTYIIELANPVVCRLWGRTAEQLMGKGLFEALPEAAGMGYEELLDQVMATGEPHVAHAMPAVHDRDGRRDTVYWDFVYVPMHEADGRIYGAMVIATEVTEQVLARQRVQQLNDELEARVAQRTAETQAALLQAQEQREQLGVQQHLLQQILGQVPAAVATLTGPEHRFTFFNDRYLALSADRAVLGKTVAEVFPEVIEQGFIDLLDQVYITGKPFLGHDMPIELFGRTTGKPEQRYVDFVYQPLMNGQGQNQGILAFVLDTTEAVLSRRQAETLQGAMLSVAQRQAQQRQELYQIFEQTPVSIVLLREPDHRIDYFNPAFADVFPPEEWTGPLRGHTIAEVYPRVQMAGLVRLLDLVFETGEPQAVIDMPLAELQPGSPRYVTFAYQAYREQGRIVGVAAFVYDVTDQVLARQQVQALNEELAAINGEMQSTNAELNDANTRLTRTNADLDTFVYSASHDLKSPITNIEGLLLALRQQLPPAALQADLVPRLLDMMQGAVSRFQQTLGHLTDVTQLQHALLDQPAEAVDLPALVESVRLDILPELTAAGATLTVDLSSCPELYFSAKNLRSILYNLFSNAVKYCSPDRPPLVQLRCLRHPSGQAVLEVQDNGLGLTPAQQGELFRLFRRLHHHVPGSGVGLYMVKKMVENGGGTLAVQSMVDVGTTFSILLPMPGPPLT